MTDRTSDVVRALRNGGHHQYRYRNLCKVQTCKDEDNTLFKLADALERGKLLLIDRKTLQAVLSALIFHEDIEKTEKAIVRLLKPKVL